jgi:hypothetical protein
MISDVILNLIQCHPELDSEFCVKCLKCMRRLKRKKIKRFRRFKPQAFQASSFKADPDFCQDDEL